MARYLPEPKSLFLMQTKRRPATTLIADFLAQPLARLLAKPGVLMAIVVVYLTLVAINKRWFFRRFVS